MTATPAQAHLGDRIVVRYRLDAARLSDVTGRLVDDGDPLRVERDGAVVSVARSAITSIRLLSAVPVRASEIRDLEFAAAMAWPGAEHAWIDGWLVRAGHRISRRANSAVGLDFAARADADALVAIGSWYVARDLPMLVAVPERLRGFGGEPFSGKPASDTVHVLTRDLGSAGEPGPAPDSVVFTEAPSAAWVRAYLGDDVDGAAAVAVLGAHLGDTSAVTFAAVAGPDAAGTPVAIGRAAVTESPHGDRWVGLTALWTDPAVRRRGLGDTILDALQRWGVEHGATRAYLQVEAGNRIAGRWYRARGFTLHHRYEYRRVTNIAGVDIAGVER